MISAVVVEDDPMVAHLNRQYLEKVSEVKVAATFANGREAYRWLKEHTADLVVLDIYMPELSGLELLRLARREGLTFDAIMVTAANEAKQIEEVLRLGVVDYLVKPFTERRFMEAMVKYLAKMETLHSGQALDQERIDRLIGQVKETTPPEMPKGLQVITWNLILDSLANERGQFLDCEAVAAKVELSKVTIRRYLKHMASQKLVDSRVDYETGGRPSVRYRLRSV
ncbi:MAG: response regulator [Deltaproteobacteria bacterium]|jgi:response regulator of citrate/malate metabolism|nr:response regulator [Deltaproteobacteria bacterium]